MTGEVAIRASGLAKRYGDTLALDALDLAIAPGEVYGFLGPNGAGKTTTIRLLLGLQRPTAGRSELFGVDAWGDPVTAHRRVAYVAGEPALWPSLTGAETFHFLAEVRGGTDVAYRDILIDRFKLDTRKKIRTQLAAKGLEEWRGQKSEAWLAAISEVDQPSAYVSAC